MGWLGAGRGGQPLRHDQSFWWFLRLWTVFELDPEGNYTVVHTFEYTDGAYPEAPLLLHKGALYGITANGGTLSNGSVGTGTVFKIIR